MSWHVLLHLYSLINSLIDSQIFNNLLLCSGYAKAKTNKKCPLSLKPCGGPPESEEPVQWKQGVLRKDSEVFREKIAFKVKQKNLQGSRNFPRSY